MTSDGNGLHRAVWLRRNQGIADSMERYCDAYRCGRCSECNPEVKRSRNCRTYPSGRSYCDAMIRARTEKFKRQILAEVSLLMGIEWGYMPMPPMRAKSI